MNALGFRKVLAVASLVLAGSAFAAAAAADDQVNVRFSWKLKGEYAPFYLAQENGDFKKARLSVRMGEGAGSQAALGALIQGQEDLVVLPGIFALSAIQKGIPVKLVALYHPRTPVMLISFPDKPVREPKDLIGKTVAASVGETGTTYLDVFLKLNHVDPALVKRAQMNAQARIPAFLQRQVEVVSVYQTNDLPILEETQKTPFVKLDMVKYGLAVPGLAIVAAEKGIQSRGDVLKRFLRAAAMAVAQSKKDVMAATRALRANWPGAPSEHAVFEQVKATVEAIPGPETHPIGWIDEKTIAEALQLLKSSGEIEAPKPVDTYYTNALLVP